MGATPQDSNQQFEILAVRLPRRVIDEIEAIAEREQENRSTIVRRFIRRALESERRAAKH